MTTIQIRIDEKTKKEAIKVFNDLGIDMSTGIKIFLKKVVTAQGVPFQLITENGLTIERELAILKGAQDAAKGINVTKPMEAKEAIAYLRSVVRKK